MSTRRGIALALLLALGAAPAAGQKATEIYIPIGESPGLSGVSTLVGRVDAAYPERGLLTVAASDGMYEVAVTQATRIWLDRANLGLTNTVGTLADCRPHMTVEVKMREDGAAADWIKLLILPAP